MGGSQHLPTLCGSLSLSLFFNTSRYPLERVTVLGIITVSCLIHSRDASVTGSQMNTVLG